MEFFNDLGRKFNQAAKSIAGWGRDENAPSEKLAESLKGAEAELQAAYARLGQAVYESLGKPCALPEERIAEVHAALEKLEKLEGEKKREKAQRRCPFCQSLQADNARFCSACGKPMTEDAARAVRDVTGEIEYCRECGAMREEGQTRCAFCGKAFGEEAAALKVEDTFVESSEAMEAPEEPEDEDYGE